MHGSIPATWCNAPFAKAFNYLWVASCLAGLAGVLGATLCPSPYCAKSPAPRVPLP